MIRLLMLAFVAFFLATAGIGAAETRNPEVLRVALLPDEDASTIIQDNAGLEAHLEAQLGKEVELIVTVDYATMISAMVNKHIDLGYFGPLSYCMAALRADIEPFAAKLKKGSTTYQAVVIGNVAAGVDSIAKIKGKRVAYGDPASTSSHLIPKSMIMAEGIRPDDHYKEEFTGAHDAVARTVALGHAQAGGLSKPIFESLVAKGTVDSAKVQVLAESAPFPQYPWAMQSDLEPALKQQIRQAFYSLQDKAVLKPLKAEGFAPIDDDAYDVVRELARLLDMDLSKP